MTTQAPSDDRDQLDVLGDDRAGGRAGRPPLSETGVLAGRLALGVIGLGLLVVGIGWYGISGDGALIDGQTDIRAQLPYLLSGGFLGLSLVVFGSALLITQTLRLERARSEALLEARFDALATALGDPRTAAAVDGWVVTGAAAYHDPDCRLVDGRPGQDYVTVEAAEFSGLLPCRRCLG